MPLRQPNGVPQAHLEAVYVEVFLELANYGEIEDQIWHLAGLIRVYNVIRHATDIDRLII